MAQMKLPYGREYQHWPDELFPEYSVIKPHEIGSSDVEEEVIKKAIEKPFGEKRLEDLGEAESVVIVTCDNTRAVPNKIILPLLLNQLEAAGVESKKVKILIGAGLHPPMDDEKIREFLGEDIVSRATVISHDAKDDSNLVYVGETSRNTPVWINKHYIEADARILVGMIDPHQFIGFSGGAKALAIGLGGKKLIQANHSMLTNAECSLGNIEDNPARRDLEEIGEMVGIDFILNVVVNNHKQVVKAVAGDFRLAHKEGVEIAKKVCQVKVEAADLVVASQGGYPKDVNLYQAQKGLAHASIVVKEGGVIILLAECAEGIGEDLFEDTMKLDSSPAQVLKRFATSQFKMGAHKAYLWARSLAKAKTILVSDGIDDKMANIMMVTKAKDLKEALEIAKLDLPSNPRIALMPKASSTIPVIEQGESHE